MSQNSSISNCIYHYSPNNLVIKDQGTFTLTCSICYAQCLENIRSRHKQLLLASEIQKPIILNEKSKSFFLEWSEQLIITLTQAQYSHSPLEYITNFAFILSQCHNLIKAEKEQLNKLFSQVLVEQKDIFKGNIDFVQDLHPSQLTAELFLADLYNMVAEKAEDSLSIILVKFQTLLKQRAHHLGLTNWIQKLQQLQFNKNFGQRLIQSKQKTLSKYYQDIFFQVALPPIQHNKRGYPKVPQVQKSPSIKTESVESQEQSSNLLKESEVIDRRVIVEDRKSSNVKNISIEIQSPIKKLQTPTQTPKNRIDTQNKHQSPSVKSENEKTKSKLSTASGKKNEMLQNEIHNRIIKEENQISQDLQNSKNLGNKYPSHSENIAKLSEIIKILNVQNKKLKNWKEGVALQTTNFNKKIRQITGLVQVLREVHKKEKQAPSSDVDEERMINLLIEQYQQLLSKHQFTIQQLFSKKKQNEGIKKENNALKLQVQQLSTKIKIFQRQSEGLGSLQLLRDNIKQLNEQMQEYKQKIVSLKIENEAIKIKNLEEESQIFLKTQRQIDDLTKINNQYLNMMKEKDRMLEEMQERCKGQVQSIQENLQKKQKQKEDAWQTEKNNLKQDNKELAKLYEDEQYKKRYDKEHHNFDEDVKRENLTMKEELKVQKQKLIQALEVTRELVRLDQLKQRQIDELKEQLAKSQIQIQKLFDNLSRAQKLIQELGKEEENQILGPTTLDEVKQAENEFLVINTSRQNENISEIKQGECQFESRICNLEKKVRQLEQELRVENNSYNDSLLQDLIETESEVKAKQFEINKFISLIEELLTQLPEEQRKKYQQKLHKLHL